jgi:tol-pal system protein YbgF
MTDFASACTRGNKTLPILLVVALVWMAPGCAATSQVSRLEDEVRRLQTVVDEMQKREAELKVRLEELGERAGAPAEAAVPLPEGEQAAALEPAAPPAPPLVKPPAGAAPHEMYNAAFTRFNLGQHPEAIELFGQFLAVYPKHDLADNAQYWIGECLYARHEYERAVEEFQRVVDEHPTGNKVPDAFVKRGLALLELDRRAEAIENLQTVIEAYPASDAATYARQRLAELQ